jgi:beta-lactamase regulating signal transducer with metallopeptidase domain
MTLAEVTTFAPLIAWICVQFLKSQSAALRHIIWVVASSASVLALLIAVSGLRIEVPIGSAQAVTPVAEVRLSSYVQTDSPKVLAESELIPVKFPVPTRKETDQFQFNFWLMLWLTGMVFVLVKMVVDRLRITRFVHFHCRQVSPEFWVPGNRLTEWYGLDRAPRIWMGSSTQIPFCFGIRKPGLVLPDSDSIVFSKEQIEICLRHELAHIARRDLLWLSSATSAARWAGLIRSCGWL